MFFFLSFSTCMKSIFVWNIFGFYSRVFLLMYQTMLCYKWHESKRLAQLVRCRNIILSMVHFAFYANEKERTSEQTAGVSFKEIHLHLISHKILQWIINEWSERKSDTHWKRVLRWGPQLFASNWTYASNCCLISVSFTREKCFFPLPFIFVCWMFRQVPKQTDRKHFEANALFHPLWNARQNKSGKLQCKISSERSRLNKFNIIP